MWQSLGFQIIGTVPESFDHPELGLVGLHVMYRPLIRGFVFDVATGKLNKVR